MRLRVKVTPGAKQNEVIGWIGDQLKLKIKAVPERGAANKELVRYLSEILDISKDEVVILRGHTSSSKVLSIDTYTIKELNKKLGIEVIQDSLI